jgi:uncharacterized repeat protein (TIGR02543 family)
VVQLTATATAGYAFDRWSGDLTGSSNPATITMDGDKAVTAHFVLATCYGLTIDVEPAGSGTVAVEPAPNCGEGYAAGTELTLTADAGIGYVFDSWSGDITGTGSPAMVTMDGDKVVTAHFRQSSWRLYFPLAAR